MTTPKTLLDLLEASLPVESIPSLESIPQGAQALALSILWRQWRALGASALGDDRDASALIDPEVLVLASLAFSRDERRLEDFAYWWSSVGTSLLSVQRARRIARQGGPTMQQAVLSYAQMAVDQGDARWKSSLDTDTVEDQGTSTGRRRPSMRGSAHPNLTHRAALMLRTRAAFGVSVKADLFAYMSAMLPLMHVTSRQLASALGYGDATLREALQDAEQAKSVVRYPGHPARYGAVEEAWPFLGIDQASWRPWREIFSFLESLSALDAAGGSSYVLASRMRTLLDEHAEIAAGVRALGPHRHHDSQDPEMRILGDVQRALQWCALGV